MRFLTLLLAVSAMLIPSLAFPLSFSELIPRICNLACTTDNLLLRVTIGSFLSSKAARNPPSLIWDDDGCSSSPDRPDGYNFLPSCQRHDFGYRNYKAQARFSEPNRQIIDDNFKRDLYNECSRYSGLSSWKGVECRRIADVYYTAVRTFGSSSARIPAVEGVTNVEAEQPVKRV
ncbi:hypothetical protein MMC24_007066 [Lignoscripta atroalba]|nr:hypothetical protein [Lignoscripta atroalba]